MATRAFPWSTGFASITDTPAQTDAATAEIDAQTAITNSATALVEAKKKTLYFTADMSGLTDDGSVVLGVLPHAITNIVGARVRVTIAGVDIGATTLDLDITKADGSTALITAPVTVNNADAANTVTALGVGAVADAAGNLIKLRGNFSIVVTSGPIFEVEVEVTK